MIKFPLQKQFAVGFPVRRLFQIHPTGQGFNLGSLELGHNRLDQGIFHNAALVFLGFGPLPVGNGFSKMAAQNINFPLPAGGFGQNLMQIHNKIGMNFVRNRHLHKTVAEFVNGNVVFQRIRNQHFAVGFQIGNQFFGIFEHSERSRCRAVSGCGVSTRAGMTGAGAGAFCGAPAAASKGRELPKLEFFLRR